MKKKYLKIYIIIATIIICINGAIYFNHLSNIRKENQKKYETTMVLISEKKYDNAIKNLQELSRYRDSDKLLTKLQNTKNKLSKEKAAINEANKISSQPYTTKKNTEAYYKIKEIIGNPENYEDEYKADAKYLIAYAELSILSDTGTNYNKNTVLNIIKDIHYYKESPKIAYFSQSMIEYYLKDIFHIDTNEWINAYNFVNNTPAIGMSKEELLKLDFWGKPKKINTTITGSGTSEQWCYENNVYVYLDNDRVTAIQK